MGEVSRSPDLVAADGAGVVRDAVRPPNVQQQRPQVAEQPLYERRRRGVLTRPRRVGVGRRETAAAETVPTRDQACHVFSVSHV